jgi:hypothetical protein
MNRLNSLLNRNLVRQIQLGRSWDQCCIFRSVLAGTDGKSRTSMQTGTRHPHVPPRPKFRPVSAGICNPAEILFWLFIYLFFSASSVLLRPFFFFFLHLTPTPTRIRVSRSGGGRRSGLLVRVESATGLQVEQAGGKMVVQLVGAFNELPERTKKEWFLVQVPCPSSFFFFLLSSFFFFFFLLLLSFFPPSSLSLSVPFLYSFFVDFLVQVQPARDVMILCTLFFFYLFIIFLSNISLGFIFIFLLYYSNTSA